MATTITLDPESEYVLQGLARERGISIDEALKELVRSTTKDVSPVDPEPGRARNLPLPIHDMGVPKVDLTKALALADELADEEFLRRESARHK